MATTAEVIGERIAREHLGSTLASVEPLPEGIMNYMYRARTERGTSFVVRVYPSQRRKIARYEPQLVERLFAAGCLAPKLIAYDCSQSTEAPAWLAYHYIEGETLARRSSAVTPAGMRRLAAAVADNLEKMSRVRVQGFGGLVTARSADDPTALKFVQRSLAAGIENAKRAAIMDPAAIERLERVHERAAEEMASFDGALAWGDLAPTNILLDEKDELAGLVDFESSFVLERALSPGYFFAISPEHPLLHALIAAARARGFEFQDNKLKLCAVLRAARMAKFAHRSLPSGAPQRPIADLLPGAIRALEELGRR